jgi:hypothetical protein
VRVELLAVPVEVILASVQHISDLRHELLIVRAGAEGGQVPPDPRLPKLLEDINPDGVAGAGARAQAEAARAAGLRSVDIELEVSPATAPSYPRMVAALEEADELCRELELLTLAAPPEVVRFRRWAAAELVAQLTGGTSPEPFPG